MKVSLPVDASWISARKPPPIPEASGCTTDSDVATATAASTALPPLARVSKPASVASALALAIAAVFVATLSRAWATTANVATIITRTGRDQRHAGRRAIARCAFKAGDGGVFRSDIRASPED